jgi:hypothetical protein
MKIVYSGLESSGKSLMMSRIAEKVYKRNKYWHKLLTKKQKACPRTMAFNQPMSQEFITKIKRAGLKYLEWRDFNEIERLTDADIFIDELLKIFPARGSDPLLPHQMDFLTQGAKSGIHIYATSQDFSQVHKQFRLLTNKVYMVKKLCGSPRPMKSRPPIPMIWGICTRTSVKPSSFTGDTATMEQNFIPIPFTVRKKDIRRYDTLYKVPRANLPDLRLRTQRVYAEDDNGNIVYEKTRYKE